MKHRTASLLVVAAAVLWSGGGVGIKGVDLPALSLAGYRSFFAAITMAMAVLFAPQRPNAFFTTIRRPTFLLAATAYAVMVISFVAAVKRTSASNAIFIQYTGAVYVALLAHRFLGERMVRSERFAIAGCLLGLGFFFSEKISPGAFWGNILAVVSSLGFAALPVLLRMDALRADRSAVSESKAMGAIVSGAPIVAMAFGNLLAAVLCSPAMVEHPPRSNEWGALILLGVLQIGLPYILYGIAVRRLRALESSLLSMIEPVLGPLWVFLAIGETPTPRMLVGAAIILTSVSLPLFAARRQEVLP